MATPGLNTDAGSSQFMGDLHMKNGKLYADTAGLEFSDGTTQTTAAAPLANVGTPGAQSPKVTTDAQGRVISSAALAIGDMPSGVNSTAHSQYYGSRSTSIGTVSVSGLEAGQYSLQFSLETTASGTGNVVISFSWVSGGVSRSISTGGSSLTAPMMTSAYSFPYVLNVDAGTTVSYSATYTSSGSYALSASLVKR